MVSHLEVSRGIYIVSGRMGTHTMHTRPCIHIFEYIHTRAGDFLDVDTTVVSVSDDTDARRKINISLG